MGNLSGRILVADIGGTYNRFGLSDERQGLRLQGALYCADYTEPAATLEECLTGQDLGE